MLKRIVLLAATLGLLAVPVQAANTYWTAARVNSCNTALGVLPIGISVCDILYDQEASFLGITGTTGMYTVGSDAPGNFIGANVGANLTELTATTANAGSQIIAVEAATVGAVFDNCVNVEECFLELGGSGADEGAGIITLATATRVLYDAVTDVDAAFVQLTETDAGSGDAIVGHVDASGLTGAATTAAAIDQIYGNVNRVFISIYDLRECDGDGDVGAITANGGILASDTTPILAGLGTTDLQVVWYAVTIVDAVCATVLLPPNFSGASDVTINVIASKDDAGADVPAWTILSNWIAVGGETNGADVSDTTAALADDNNVQSLAATILAADVPDAPIGVSLNLVPGAHANDIVYMHGIEIVYVSE